MPKPVTILDVAREAGVSPTLVSFVFNGKNRVGARTREHILEVAARLGYRKPDATAPAEWPAPRLVGVVVPEMEGCAAWMERLSHSAFRLGYTLQFAPTLNDPVKFCHLVRAFSGTQGLVILDPPQGEDDCEAALRLCPVPYVIAQGDNTDKTIKELIDLL